MNFHGKKLPQKWFIWTKLLRKSKGKREHMVCELCKQRAGPAGRDSRQLSALGLFLPCQCGLFCTCLFTLKLWEAVGCIHHEKTGGHLVERIEEGKHQLSTLTYMYENVIVRCVTSFLNVQIMCVSVDMCTWVQCAGIPGSCETPSIV